MQSSGWVLAVERLTEHRGHLLPKLGFPFGGAGGQRLRGLYAALRVQLAAEHGHHLGPQKLLEMDFPERRDSENMLSGYFAGLGTKNALQCQ